MILEMKVPSPGESIKEVEIAAWLVHDGDYVEKDQAIAEVDSEHRDSGEREKRRRGAHDQEVLDWCLEILRPRLLAEITKRDLPLLGDPRLKAKEILEKQ